MDTNVSAIDRKPDVKSRARVGRSRVNANVRGRRLQEITRVRAAAEALVTVLARRLDDTRLHMWRVQAFSLRLGREIGLSAARSADLEMGSLLHDVGKIEVPLSILAKAGALTEEEWKRMRQHPADGYALLRELSYSEGVALIAGQHHERWDGSGYPGGLRGEQIELTARIFSVADAFDAITAERVYKAGRSYSEAREELEQGSGGQFDPRVVQAFLKVPASEWTALRDDVAARIGAPGFFRAWMSGRQQIAAA